MGRLVNGSWTDEWYDTESTGGKFVREDASWRNWVTVDGAPGPTGEGGFAAEAGRYHLYVSYACPWAHRTLIMRELQGLQDCIGVSVVHPDMLADGWTFDTDFAGATGDLLHGVRFMRDIYLRARPDCSGRVTVPVLWDRQRETIVSNESADIVRMLDGAFAHLSDSTVRYSPDALLAQIDRVNAPIYHHVNNGVYKAGFATSQQAYEEAVSAVFETLDWLEARLRQQRFLVGNVLTEADWRLFTTLVRFDAVYVGHFKCNLRRIADYPALSGYLRDLYQHEGVARTVHMDHIKQHYYYSHDMINPTRIVPAGPELALQAAHDRADLGDIELSPAVV